MSTVKEFIKERQIEISPDRFHSHLKDLEDKYNCFRQINSLDSLQDIQNKGKELNGLPISVKDSICVRGKLSSAGSRILENYTPPFDATAVERAKNAGSTFIGKLTWMSSVLELFQQTALLRLQRTRGIKRDLLEDLQEERQW